MAQSSAATPASPLNLRLLPPPLPPSGGSSPAPAPGPEGRRSCTEPRRAPRLRNPWLQGPLLLGLLLVAGLLALSGSRRLQVAGDHVDRVETPRLIAALTFDDGPDPVATPALLEALRRSGAHATFFLEGRRAVRHPDLVRAILREGHEVGNHSWSHPLMLFEDPGRYRQEIDRTDALLRQLGTRGSIPFRAPYGRKLVVLPVLLAHRHKLDVLWDVEAGDWQPLQPAAIARTVEQRIRPGSIVLLHERPETAAALGPLLESLRARGYRLVTVSQLLQAR